MSQVMFSWIRTSGTLNDACHTASPECRRQVQHISNVRDWAMEQIYDGHPMRATLGFVLEKAAENAQDAIIQHTHECNCTSMR